MERYIAVYELESNNNIKKGIIFVGKVVNSIKSEDFRAEKYLDRIKWIGQEDISTYSDNAVSDFENTLNTVFNGFNDFFR